jgi:predicted dehydrogenase
VSALRKSKHLYIYPSLLKSYNQALELIKLANEANVTLQVQRTTRYNAVLSPIPEKQCDIRLIEIQCHTVNGTNKSDTSVFSMILKNLDIIHTIIKSNSSNIKACGVNIVNNSPDIINARIEFDNGSVANLNCSRIALKNSHIATFIQKDKIIKIDFNTNKIQMLFPEKINSNKTSYKIKALTYKATPNNPLYNEFSYFRDSINNNSKSLSNVEDGFKSLLVAHKIFEKAFKN